MNRYRSQTDFRHGAATRAGVLLVNLGTPDAPTTRAVRRYLREFLWDPRVIETPRLLWWLILHGIVLRIRPRRSARNYAKIWTQRGSPLLVHSQDLAAGLQQRLDARGSRVTVALAMSYGNPDITTALEGMRQAGVQRLIVLPMYPQYSNTTAGSVFERIGRELSQWRRVPELRFAAQYCEEPRYLEAIAGSIERHWAGHGRRHLLFSFHSIPRRYFDNGDPYHCHCQATARLVAARLGLAESEWSLGFQSRFGREAWLTPYLDKLLHDYAHAGPKRVTVVCPGFATDCLETLEEIELQNREAFLAHGGEAFDYVPALNASDAQLALYEHLVLQHGAGWPELDGRDDSAGRAAARGRALRLGARD